MPSLTCLLQNPRHLPEVQLLVKDSVWCGKQEQSLLCAMFFFFFFLIQNYKLRNKDEFAYPFFCPQLDCRYFKKLFILKSQI